MIVTRANWGRWVWLLRIAAPLTLCWAVALAGFAMAENRPWAMAINSFCAGVLSVLTFVEWFVFKPSLQETINGRFLGR